MPLNQPDCKGIPEHVRMGVSFTDISFNGCDPSFCDQFCDVFAPVALVTANFDVDVSEGLIRVAVDRHDGLEHVHYMRRKYWLCQAASFLAAIAQFVAV